METLTLCLSGIIRSCQMKVKRAIDKDRNVPWFRC